MKHQKMMTWVSISGTALSIFLVMALFMTDQVKSVEISPESNRHRILIAQNLEVGGNNALGSTSGINKELIDQLYLNLDGVEKVSYVYAFPWKKIINLRGKDPVSVHPKRVDNEFWNIYDFRFIDGKPFDQADIDNQVRKVIISRSIARQLFGEDNVAGRDVEIDYIAYTVCGVVEDVSPLLKSTYAQIYIPYKPGVSNEEFFGDASMVLLMKEGVDPQHIKTQVENRYKTINAGLTDRGQELVYHLQPYTSQEMAMFFGSNNSPDVEAHDKKMWIFYTVLILLPAINLSSMTRSRLRHRVSEIGVRRAFGAKKSSIVLQMFGENLLITIFGGIIGLLLSVIFVMTASHLLFCNGDLFTSSLEIINARPTFGMLFKWQTFFIALLYCLILNILSATIPSWQASRVAPAVAITKSR
ncbi:MAG: FtsX-like permease family protein [Bacteroides sp.]|nr:FtsX-like permease family protein [Bacteroides sp.]